MASLSDSVYNVLKALVELYNKENSPVKSRDIANALGIHEGYVRNMLSILKSMGLVISKAGPHGGYIPTSKATDVLSRQTFSVPIASLGNVVGYALDITLIGLLSDKPFASMRVVGDLAGYVDREVRVGPLPSGLVLIGRVIKADIESLMEISSIISIPRTSVKNIMTPNPVAAKPDDSIEPYVKLFIEKRYRGIPVVNEERKPIGLLMASKLMEALYGCRKDVKVKDLMVGEPPVIHEEEDIHEAIRIMVSGGIGRLLVVNSEDKLVGIVTRTDILRRIATLEQLV
ncbi:CBS domain-containing protein [Pyrobaculum neutrophilum]|uniref:Signal transduction protein with CBS domains n=1 Tax=Pyrobaculum neutrophilum (strain DSM 2338 / JCM 9278 / NBRC 100436 / V24Sta) TaxID=444157 RepID=B1Y9S9_PYRNV|nr:CBS domain-containing protein [Pyrobaculum neutrophilum]ACB40479.1 putative signal transduction protein with CBS domains [Pyrobaculum neutrophilum V24Sta]